MSKPSPRSRWHDASAGSSRGHIAPLGALWIDCIEMSETLIRRAASLAEQLNLRGYDAVHCASAEAVADADLVVASGDGALLNACETLGFNVAPMSLGRG